MTNADQIKLETFDNFINWLNDHTDPIADAVRELEPPKALDVLLDAESRYFAALENLDKKHRGLTTVEQIDKLTKDIEKLCK